MVNARDRISLALDDTSSRITVNAKKGDTKREIIVSITDNGSPYIIEQGCAVAFTAVKPDGNLVFNKCRVNEDNTVTYQYTMQTVNVVGVVDCELKVYSEDFDNFTDASKLTEKVTTPRFRLLVEKPVFTDEDIPESGPELNAIYNLVLNAVREIIAEVGTDKTLTVDGYPADAKEVGDRLGAIHGILEFQSDLISEATQKAQAAANTAVAASSAATSAQTAAGEAKADARNAVSIATDANTTANEAKELAQDALPKQGGTMSGTLRMDGQRIVGLEVPVDNDHAATKGYVDSVAKASTEGVRFEVDLLASNWVQQSATGKWWQIIDSTNVREDDQPHWGVVYSGTRDQMIAQQEAFDLVDDLETMNNSMQFWCFRDKPQVDLKIQLEILRTSTGEGNSGDALQEQINNAVEWALQQAEESGRFDGADGVGIRSVAIREVY